jgi:PAS domain S-box-containing protein
MSRLRGQRISGPDPLDGGDGDPMRELRRREAQLAEAQAIAHIGSWTWDIDADSVSWSDELYRIHGLEPAPFQPTHQWFMELVHVDDRELVGRTVKQALHDGLPFSFEYRIVAGETVRWLHGRGLVDVGAEGRPTRMAGTAHDITERKAAEEARLRLAEEQLARKAAEDAVRARDEFLSVAGHELRTPLTPLQLQLESLERDLAVHDAAEGLREKLQIASSQVHRLACLVDDLLDVTRIAAGVLELRPEVCDLAVILSNVADHFRGEGNAKRCEIRLQVDGPVVGRWDPPRLEQVVSNLLSNALRYGAGAPVELVARPHGDRALLFVRDRGPGIAPEDVLRIFDRFERASGRGYGGLGLGLYVTRQIVEAHSGNIQVTSQPGAGSCFTVSLPLSAA